MLLHNVAPTILPLPWNLQTPSDLAFRLRTHGIPVAIWEQRPQAAQHTLLPHTGRFSYLAIKPQTIHSPSGVDPLQQLAELHSIQHARVAEEFFSDLSDELPPFIGGHIAVLAYDCARYHERVRGMHPHACHPDAVILHVQKFVVWDWKQKKRYLIEWTDTSNGLDRGLLQDCAEQLEDSNALPLFAEHSTGRLTAKLRYPSHEFIDMVKAAQEYIRAGDIFQVVLSNHLEIDSPIDPLLAYRLLTQDNPSPYQFMIPLPHGSLVGASPEMMLCLHELENGEREVAMRLVAGTYPKDELISQTALRADPKEQAEHIMLVDHIRNDIGKVAQIGTVVVRDLCAVETYRDVHHLVSQVSGVLKSECTALDALRAAFPIATLTGTPKIRAMEIISELEAHPRGFFGGAVVLLAYNGFLESGVTIRTMFCNETASTIQAGAGIVFDSIPEREFEECLWKAQALLRLLGAEISD